MGTINKKRVSRTKTESHKNWMGGASYFVSDPILTLRLAASSCFFGEPQYYAQEKGSKLSAKVAGPKLTKTALNRLREQLNAVDPADWRDMTPKQAIESAIDKALDFSVEKTLQEAVRLRTEDHIRTTPQVILVRAAHHAKAKGTPYIRMYAPKIVLRGDEPAVGLAYHFETYGKGKALPNSLKKAWGSYLSKQNEYNLAKYRMENRVVKTVDVVNLVHPVATAPLEKLMKGTLKLNEETWESYISANGSSKETWTKAIDKMGHMALLRNLRNLEQNGVDSKLYLSKLTETAREGKQLPFRYYSAYRALGASSPQVKDAIEECMEITLENVPHFAGRTMSLCDNSGSARGATTSSMGTMQVATIANLTGCITGAVSGEGYVGVFGDTLSVMPIRKKSSIFDNLDKAEGLGGRVGGNTENGIWLFWDKAIREKEHWDNVFVYSDMQAGHGGLYGTNPREYADYLWVGDRHIDVSKLINAYRSKVNPKVNVYLVQVAGYQDTILPEFYERTYILGGWGEGVLRFAGQMNNFMNQLQQQKAV